jgi:hypothetical protein
MKKDDEGKEKEKEKAKDQQYSTAQHSTALSRHSRKGRRRRTNSTAQHNTESP